MSRQYAFLRIDAARRFRLDGRDVNSENPPYGPPRQDSDHDAHRCPARPSGRGRPPLCKPRGFYGGDALPQRGKSPLKLQRVQGPGAFGPRGHELGPDRQHLFRPERNL